MAEHTTPGILIDVSKTGERLTVGVAGCRYECVDMNAVVLVVNAVMQGRPIPETVTMRRSQTRMTTVRELTSSPNGEATVAEAEDRAGVGIADMIMVLLTRDPTKPWNQVMIMETLKITDEEFKKAIADLGEWVTLEPVSNLIQAADRAGFGTGNGYWTGDQEKYENAQRVAAERNGIGLGNR